jgi:hypothetical protein
VFEQMHQLCIAQQRLRQKLISGLPRVSRTTFAKSKSAAIS